MERVRALIGPAVAVAGVALTVACSAEAEQSTTGPASATASALESSPAPSLSRLAPALRDALARAPGQAPRPATSPGQVVAQLVAAEAAIADRAVYGDTLDAAGHLQQVAYRELGRRPRWDGAVLAALPARLRATVRDNIASRRAFIALQGGRFSDTLPAWRVVEPEPAIDLLAHYREAEAAFGVDWEYLTAINLVETGLGRIQGTSVAAARGPMQFIASTWAQYGRGDIEDPRDAIMAAGRYLAARGFTERGGIPRALYSYNNSDAYVRGVTRLAQVLQRDPAAFRGYYHWEIYYASSAGDVWLPVGYDERVPVPVRRYLREHPASS